MIFYTKIVDGESERSSTRFVLPETRSERCRKLAMRSKMFFELLVGKDSGFLEAVHAFLDFNVKKTTGIEVIVGEAIFVKNFLSDVTSMDAHVLKFFHYGSKKEIFEVSGAVASAVGSIRDGAVQM